jgi:histidinol dehydrogenase
VRIVKSNTAAGRKTIQSLVNRGKAPNPRVEAAVRKILRGIERNGDVALRRFAVHLDALGARQCLLVHRSELLEALKEMRRTDREFVRALESAADNIRQFAKWQKPQEWSREI